MPHSSGWISSESTVDLASLSGYLAEIYQYYCTPHRTLVIRLTRGDDSEEERFIVCHGCRWLQFPTHWTIVELTCRKTSEDVITLADSTNDVRIDCYAGRLLDRESGVKWLMGDHHY